MLLQPGNATQLLQPCGLTQGILQHVRPRLDIGARHVCTQRSARCRARQLSCSTRCCSAAASPAIEPAPGSAGAAELPPAPTQQSYDFRSRDLGQWRKLQLRRIAKFTGPALSIPLADPIMSLVDTICVGQFAGTLELAALGPCMLIFSFFTYLSTSLSIATVSGVAEALKTQDVDMASRRMSTALIVAAAFGMGIFVVLQIFSRRLVMLTGASATLVDASVSYLKIRAWSAPAVLITMVAQSALLAQQDSITPLIWVAVQTVLNVLGDVALIKFMAGGLPGAAWATLLSQLAGTAGLLWMLAFSAGQVRPRLLVPRRQELASLGSTAGPATAIYACKNVCYLMLQGTATTLQPLLVAGHQVVWQVWCLCSYCHSPMEQAALAFLPVMADKDEARELIKLLVALGVCVGVLTALVAAGLPSLLPQLFTGDRALWPVMRSIAPQAVGSMLFCGVDVACSGVLVAEKDLMFIAKSMAGNMVLLAGYFAMARAQQWGLDGVWSGLMLFFMARAIQSTSRIYWLDFKKRSPDTEHLPERQGINIMAQPAQ